MSKLSVTKGKAYERRIATILRDRFPDAIVRRSSQADSAVQSDVYVTGGPPVLARLWIECQTARHPTPIAKLEQATRDLHRAARGYDGRMPIAITHQLGARTIYVTTRLWVLDAIRSQLVAWRDEAVTMEIGEFLEVVADAREGKEAA